MLISLTMENWMSFRDEVTFSMVASRERQHGERLSRLEKYRLRVLPVSAIYGGNASGKSNFFKALGFAQELVVEGTKANRLIPTKYFRLDSQCENEPTRFRFEILIDETIYEYSFAVTRKAVLEEKLVKIMSSSEKVLFQRENEKIVIDDSFKSKSKLEVVFEGTRDNQLFVTNSVDQRREEFDGIYKWFKEKLILIAPTSKHGPFEQLLSEEHPVHVGINQFLPQLDTGITKMSGENIDYNSIELPESLKEDIQSKFEKGKRFAFIMDDFGDRYVIMNKNDQILARKLVFFHENDLDKETKFEISEESDGTRRLVDLLPAFLILLKDENSIFVIDELDRSLHTLLTRQLLESYLRSCHQKKRSQLLFTTHDVLLMDQNLLRRDEMWVTERDSTGNTTIFSFSEYEDVRYDKDLRKSYLQGRLGGIPRFLIDNVLMTDECNEEDEQDGEKEIETEIRTKTG